MSEQHQFKVVDELPADTRGRRVDWFPYAAAFAAAEAAAGKWVLVFEGSKKSNATNRAIGFRRWIATKRPGFQVVQRTGSATGEVVYRLYLRHVGAAGA